MLPETAAGAAIMSEMPWGAHLCYFYETKQDLLQTSAAFLQAGLKDRAFCLWITYDPITESDARQALNQAVAEAELHLARGAMEIFVHHDPGDELPDPRAMIRFLKDKLDAALAQGYTGMRVAGSPSCLQKTNLSNFRQFENELANSISGRPIISLCNFPLAASSAAEILDAARTHEFVLANRLGEWEIIETPEPKLTKAELAKLNQQLEQRVEERTRALEEANQKLRAQIARREQVEADLRRQTEILQTIFDHAPVAISFLNQTGQVQMVNPEWERMVGYSLEDILSQRRDVIAEAFPNPVQRQRAREFVANPSSEWADFEATARNGEITHSTWALVQLSDGSRIGIGQDITQRKKAEQEVRKQKEILQTIFDHIPVMITFGDAQVGLRLVNRQWEQTLGWSLEEIRRDNIDILAENYPDPKYRAQALEFAYNSDGAWRDFKTTVRNGRVIDTSWMVLHLPDGTIIGIGQDITERKRAEEALRESEERFRQLAENINDLFWIKTPDLKRVIYMSPIYKRITGRAPEATYREDYQTFLDKILPEDREIMAGIIRRGGGEEFDVEYRVILPDGKLRWVHERGFPIRDQAGRVYRMAGIARNITERKQTEERLKATSEQLRALSASLQSAQEKEAARIARQIHDDVGGILTSLRWEIEALEKMVQDPATMADVQAVRQKLTAMIGATDAAVNVVRRIASELRPSILDDLGLLEAIEWQAQQFESRTGIQCRLLCSAPTPPLDNQQSTAVFRIVQEALTNVMRHAQAAQVNITARQEADTFVLEVQDDGRGVTQAEKLNRNSLGLLGMQERAHLIGAAFEISGEPGLGTTLCVRVPVSAHDPAEGAR